MRDRALRMNEYMAHRPTIKQAAFMIFPGAEALFGGAGGGGKSDVGLMCMLQYADVENHSSLIVRRTFQALTQPGALIDRSHQWLDGSKAHWDGQSMMWRFPSRAKLAFRHLNDRNALETIASAEYQDAYVDELTQLTQMEYKTIQSRLRRPSSGPLSLVPLRMRSGTNPGGRGHEWVKNDLVRCEMSEDKMFLQARINDNPFIDREAYIKTLSRLPPIVREAVLEGNWDLVIGAGIFRREWFRIAPRPNANEIVAAVRYWDTAATEDTGNNDPDWTAGVLIAKTLAGLYFVCHVVRVRATAGSVRKMAIEQGKQDAARIGAGKYTLAKEQGPGDDGKANADEWAKDCTAAHLRFRRDKKTVDKMERAGPWASACENGSVRICTGEWTEAYLDEHANFDDGDHDDQEDASSGAFFLLDHKSDGLIKHYENMAREALGEEESPERPSATDKDRRRPKELMPL